MTELRMQLSKSNINYAILQIGKSDKIINLNNNSTTKAHLKPLTSRSGAFLISGAHIDDDTHRFTRSASYLILSAAYMMLMLMLLLVAGLLFRTKETLGLIVISLTLELLKTYSVATIAGIIVLFVVGARFGLKPDDAS